MILYAITGQPRREQDRGASHLGSLPDTAACVQAVLSFPDLEGLCRPLKKHTEEIRLLLRSNGIGSFTCRSGSW